jgi:hypothetical protein
MLTFEDLEGLPVVRVPGRLRYREVQGDPKIPLEHDGSGYSLTFITDAPDEPIAVAAVGGIFAWHRVCMSLVNGTRSWPLPDGIQVDRVSPGTALVTGPRGDQFLVTG